MCDIRHKAGPLRLLRKSVKPLWLQIFREAIRDEIAFWNRRRELFLFKGQSKSGIIALFALGLLSCSVEGEPHVRIVGSSTIFPFAAKVAEIYSEQSSVGLVVEQTGSGGGHKLFCSGDPSINATTSSRPQKPSELQLCQENGIESVVEVRLGYDGIVLARSIDAVPMALDAKLIYRALARELPLSDKDCSAVLNPYRSWSEVDPSLPDELIEVYGPPPTSGTRDAFVETAMEMGARSFSCLAEMEQETPNLFRSRAHELREDGLWIDAGENDNALIRTLTNTPNAVGVFGFSFLDQNADKVTGVPVGGVKPSLPTIRDGKYPVVRDLYLYLQEDGDPHIVNYALEFLSDQASGERGYLEEMGLIPLPDEERSTIRQRLLQIVAEP